MQATTCYRISSGYILISFSYLNLGFIGMSFLQTSWRTFVQTDLIFQVCYVFISIQYTYI